MLQMVLRSLRCHHLKFGIQTRQISKAAEAILGSLQDFEQTGVPENAGSASGGDGFDLARMHRFLEGLGNPQRDLKAVHVAGTKGKGSISVMLSTILMHSGYKVGTYTSPHIASSRERIALNVQSISEEEFDSLTERCSGAISRAAELDGLSRFEAMTGIAFCHFREQKVDVAVIEAGLGGVKDATNVFPSSSLQLALLSAIGLEHQKQLGDTLTEIATAKAGICKQGRPVLVSKQPEPEAEQTIAAVAADIGAPVLWVSQEVSVTAAEIVRAGNSVHQNIQIQAASQPPDEELLRHIIEVKMRLVGQHQTDNAAAAVAAALQLWRQGWQQISAESIKKGLEAAVLPGRFQVSKLGECKPWLVLDGAHTPASAAALSETLAQAFPGEPLALIVAMANDKDHQGVLAALRRARPAVIVFTTVPIAGANDRSAPPGMMVGHWQAGSFTEDRPLRSRELIKANIASALAACERELFSAAEDGVICVTGSLHAVAAALKVS